MATATCLQVYVSPSSLYEEGKGGGSGGDVVGKTSEWMEVEPGGEKPFDFSSKGKMRHRASWLHITIDCPLA